MTVLPLWRSRERCSSVPLYDQSKDLMLTLLFLMITAADIRTLPRSFTPPRRPSRLSETVKARLAYSALILAARMTLAQFSIRL